MRLREKFHIQPIGDQELEVELSITFPLDDEERIEVREEDGGQLLLAIERTVDPLKLTIETKSGLSSRCRVASGGRSRRSGCRRAAMSAPSTSAAR